MFSDELNILISLLEKRIYFKKSLSTGHGEYTKWNIKYTIGIAVIIYWLYQMTREVRYLS